MTKSRESIWTKDITPHVVNFMTMDITPNFKSEVWTQDITHIVIGSLAVFGLVVSSLITTLGVAAAGVNMEVAFAQQSASNQMVAQTATIVLAEDNHQAPGMMSVPMANGSTAIGTASSTVLFCPKLSRTIGRGTSEGTTTGDVGQLQQFIANHFGLNKDDVVTGHFGSTTQAFLEKFQQEQGISPAPFAGPLTRAAIARLCNPTSHDSSLLKGNEGDGMGSSTMMGSTTLPMPPRHDDFHPAMGSSTMMGSTTLPMPPRHDDFHPGIGSTTMGSSTLPHTGEPMGSSTEYHGPMLPPPPKAPAPTTTPVTYYNNTSNSASVIEAINEIGDGYGRLLTASLSMLGL